MSFVNSLTDLAKRAFSIVSEHMRLNSTKDVELVISVNKANMLKAMKGEETFDIRALLKPFSDVKEISGDPQSALRVSVPSNQVAEIKEALKDQCTVGPYREFSTQPAAFNR